MKTLHAGMEYLVHVVQELSMSRDLDTITRIVRTAARKLSGADGASFVLREGDHCFYADEDAISPLWKGSRFPIRNCISGWAMVNRQTVTVPDIYADPRIPHDVYRPTFVKSLTMVPIRSIEPIGAIGNYWASHHVPTEREIRLLQSLADITAVAIENVSLYQQLENRVKQRTAELVEANESLEAYNSSISHDLRAPLRSIRFIMETIQEHLASKKDETLTGLQTRMLNRVSHMDALIEGLLAFSKLGQLRISYAPFCTTGLVKEICQEMLQQHADRKIEFTMREPLPDVPGDGVLIRQVWSNLISNAVKYTAQKPVAVIEFQAAAQETHIIYSIRDNGAGFNMQFADRLFQMFQRMHSEKEFSGIGIGLSLSKRIINRHGGELWAEAKVDEGATFHFSLPTAPIRQLDKQQQSI